MKFTQIVCTTLLCLLFAINVQGQSLTFSPEKPAVESEVSFTYNPDGGPLEDLKISAIAYEFGRETPDASEIELEKVGEVYEGKVKLATDTRTLFIKVYNEQDDINDNNGGNGYGTMVYTEGKPAKGAYIAYGGALSVGIGTFFLELDKNDAEALKMYQKELSMYPDLKEEHIDTYAFLASKSEDPADLDIVHAHIQAVVDKKKASEEEMMGAYRMTRFTQNEDHKAILEKRMRKRFKKGSLVQEDQYNAFRKAENEEAKLAIYEKFKKDLAETEGPNYTLMNMASSLASSFGHAENWEKFDEFVADIEDKDRLIGLYNNLAWGLVGAGLEGEGKSLEKAAELSWKTLEATKAQIKEPGEDQPSFYTPKQLKQNAERSYAMYADTYALIMHKLGKTEEAMKYQEIAVEINEFKDAETNERYCVYYEKIHGETKCEDLIAGFIKAGNATPMMKTRHKELFLENNSIESAYTKYLASLEADALKKIKEDLAKKMIDEAAPDFTLKNVAGETVQLSAMKDKVVVLDFWATWCGPCIMSFPGMARAQEELKEQQDVVFLFINTWENGDDKTKIAGDFMKKKGYPFNIPMDSEDKVVKSYGVDGIPTKFIIGPDNRIRFKSVGFNNNEDAMVAELKYMIEMAREGEDEMAVGAPR